jgi:hypothetical protein
MAGCGKPTRMRQDPRHEWRALAASWAASSSCAARRRDVWRPVPSPRGPPVMPRDEIKSALKDLASAAAN